MTESTIIIKPFKYSEATAPEGYVCGRCGATGVRLYRRYQTFLEHQALLCRGCGCDDQKQDEPDYPSEHTIGWLVAAVPTEDGETYWGFTSVPPDGVKWWNNLPKTNDKQNGCQK